MEVVTLRRVNHNTAEGRQTRKRRLTAIIGAIAAPLLALTGIVVTAGPAIAHASNTTSTVSCVAATGEGIVAWKVDNDYNEDMEVTYTSKPSVVPLGTIIPATGGGANTFQTFNETIGAPALGLTSSITLAFVWHGDNFPQGNRTYTSAAIPGNCTSPTASASATAVGPGCSVDGSATFSLNHAHWLDPTPTTPGSYNPRAEADAGYTFPDGSTIMNVPYAVNPGLPIYDPACIMPQTGSVTPVVAYCTGAPTWIVVPNSITLSATPGGIWTIKYDFNNDGDFADANESTVLPIGQGGTFSPPNGYVNYIVELRDGDSVDGNAVADLDTTWWPIDASTVACSPPTVGGPCVATSSDTSTPANPNGWAPDGAAPTYTVNGLEYLTPTAADKQSLYHGITLKLADLTELSYTIDPINYPEASIQLRIFADGAPNGFSTLYGEFYLNGGAPAGKTTVDVLNWKFTSTRPANTGGLAFGTLNDFLKLKPNADIFLYGPNQGANNAGGHSVVSEISINCHKTTFGFDVITAPTPPVVPGPTCYADGGPLPPADVNGVITPAFHGPGNYDYVYTAPAGVSYPGGVLTITYPAVVLPQLLPSDPLCQTKVTPVTPTSTAQFCKAGNLVPATVTIPSLPVGVTYLLNGTPVVGGKTYPLPSGTTTTVTAQPLNNTFALTDPLWSWSVSVPAAVVCIAELAFSGQDAAYITVVSQVIMAALGGIVVGTLIVLFLYRRRPRES